MRIYREPIRHTRDVEHVIGLQSGYRNPHSRRADAGAFWRRRLRLLLLRLRLRLLLRLLLSCQDDEPGKKGDKKRQSDHQDSISSPHAVANR